MQKDRETPARILRLHKKNITNIYTIQFPPQLHKSYILYSNVQCCIVVGLHHRRVKEINDARNYHKNQKEFKENIRLSSFEFRGFICNTPPMLWLLLETSVRAHLRPHRLRSNTIMHRNVKSADE